MNHETVKTAAISSVLSQFNLMKVAEGTPMFIRQLLAGKNVSDLGKNINALFGAQVGGTAGGVLGGTLGGITGGIYGAFKPNEGESRLRSAARGAGKGTLIGGAVGGLGGAAIGVKSFRDQISAIQAADMNNIRYVLETLRDKDILESHKDQLKHELTRMLKRRNDEKIFRSAYLRGDIDVPLVFPFKEAIEKFRQA